jgi:CheY-like chemotaxis protein
VAIDGEFKRRIIVVDSDSGLLQACTNELRRQGYEVVTAEDGFAALQILRGAQPDVLIAELSVPGMSGFELLSVVRTRFPAISVIAMSNEYTAATVPPEALCDAFLPKTPNLLFELVEEARRLISEAPVRSSRIKPDVAPVWIPRSKTGYIILTCPECLRSFSTTEPKSSPADEHCIFCGAAVRFQMSLVQTARSPEIKPTDSPAVRSAKLKARSDSLIADSQQLRRKPRS